MDTIDLLLRDLSDCPRYTRQEERALAGRFATADEALEAREQLILSCLPWAFKISKRYWNRSLPTEDIAQYAMWGIIEAVETFDPARGRLTTWASWHVRKRIKHGIANDAYAVRLPQNVFYDGKRTSAACREKADTVRKGVRCIDVLDQGEDEALQYEDSTAVDADEADWVRSRREQVERAMGSLDERQQEVIRLRYQGMTLRAVGKELGVSRERVRQVQVVAMEKLRTSLQQPGVTA